MTKPAVADYTRRIYALRVVATDATEIRLIDYPHDLVLASGSGDVAYSAGSGYEFTGLSLTASMSPSVIDLEAMLDEAGMTRAGVTEGRWDNARAYLFATDWSAPTEDEEPLALFIFGRTHIRDERYVCQLMQLIDAVNQEVGRTISPTCWWEFGGAECGVNLATYTVTGTVTGVTGAGEFADTSRGESGGTYDGGLFTFTSGDNSGLSSEVKTFDGTSNGGEFVLFLPFPYAPQIGDAYSVRRDCAKTRPACKSYSNILNFGGFPDQPTSNMVNKVGGQ